MLIVEIYNHSGSEYAPSVGELHIKNAIWHLLEVNTNIVVIEDRDTKQKFYIPTTSIRRWYEK